MEKEEVSISIITTIFNGEPFLRRLFDSVFPNLRSHDEWIIVDDGSTDDSPSIIEKEFLNRPNCSLIKQTNQGLVSAFNKCLSLASKEYILNIDRGDYLTPEGLNIIRASLLDGRPDILHFAFQELHENGSLHTFYNYPADMDFKTKSEALNNPVFVERIGCILCSYTRQAIKRSIIGGLRLTEPAAGSDNPFMDMVFCKANSFKITRKVCYVSYIADNSISRSPLPISWHGQSLERFLLMVPFLRKHGSKSFYPLLEARDVVYSFRDWVLAVMGTMYYDKAFCKKAQRIIWHNRKMLLPVSSLRERLFYALLVSFPRTAKKLWLFHERNSK